MMPSDRRRRRLSMGNLRCRVWKGGAMVSGLSPTLPMAWHCAQCTRTNVRPRCAPGDVCACADAPAVRTAAPSSTIIRKGRVTYLVFISGNSSCVVAGHGWSTFQHPEIRHDILDLMRMEPKQRHHRVDPRQQGPLQVRDRILETQRTERRCVRARALG